MQFIIWSVTVSMCVCVPACVRVWICSSLTIRPKLYTCVAVTRVCVWGSLHAFTVVATTHVFFTHWMQHFFARKVKVFQVFFMLLGGICKMTFIIISHSTLEQKGYTVVTNLYYLTELRVWQSGRLPFIICLILAPSHSTRQLEKVEPKERCDREREGKKNR